MSTDALRELVAEMLVACYRADSYDDAKYEHMQLMAQWHDAQDAAAPDLPDVEPASPLPWSIDEQGILCDAKGFSVKTRRNAHYLVALHSEVLQLRERVAELEAQTECDIDGRTVEVCRHCGCHWICPDCDGTPPAPAERTRVEQQPCQEAVKGAKVGPDDESAKCAEGGEG